MNVLSIKLIIIFIFFIIRKSISYLYTVQCAVQVKDKTNKSFFYCLKEGCLYASREEFNTPNHFVGFTSERHSLNETLHSTQMVSMRRISSSFQSVSGSIFHLRSADEAKVPLLIFFLFLPFQNYSSFNFLFLFQNYCSFTILNYH